VAKNRSPIVHTYVSPFWVLDLDGFGRLPQTGRQAEGLAVYRRTREFLNVELGLEPGVALQQLE
jgi:hypothetical protein